MLKWQRPSAKDILILHEVVLSLLQAIPQDVVAAKFQKIREAQPLFDYASLAKPPQEDHGLVHRSPSISDILVDAMCRHAATGHDSDIVHT